MITREQITSLYRCILGREPESEQTLEWAQKHFATFEDAREDFLNSAEFLLQRGKLHTSTTQANGKTTARYAQALSSLGLVSSVGPRPSTFNMIPFGELNKVLRIIGNRLRAQFVFCYGAERIVELAFSLLAQSAVYPALLVSSRGIRDRERDLSDWLNERGLEEGISIIQKDQPIVPLVEGLAKRGLSFELILVSDPAISGPQLSEIFKLLSFCGLVMIDLDNAASKRAFKDCAEALHLDPVEIDGFGLLQRTAWYTPLVIGTSAQSNYAPRKSSFKIALASIVKNEAAKIARMLESCLPIVEWVVVVDTGSTDGTLGLARQAVQQHGKKFIGSSVAFENFAQARNAALDLVPNEADWVLMLDADEYIVAADYEKLQALLSSDVDAWMLPRYNLFDEAGFESPAPYPDRQRRLFNNKLRPQIRFSGRVHETPANVQKWGVAPANLAFFGDDCGGPHIYHTGQVSLSRSRWEEKNAFYGSLMVR